MEEYSEQALFRMETKKRNCRREIQYQVDRIFQAASEYSLLIPMLPKYSPSSQGTVSWIHGLHLTLTSLPTCFPQFSHSQLDPICGKDNSLTLYHLGLFEERNSFTKKNGTIRIHQKSGKTSNDRKGQHFQISQANLSHIEISHIWHSWPYKQSYILQNLMHKLKWMQAYLIFIKLKDYKFRWKSAHIIKELISDYKIWRPYQNHTIVSGAEEKHP